MPLESFPDAYYQSWIVHSWGTPLSLQMQGNPMRRCNHPGVSGLVCPFHCRWRFLPSTPCHLCGERDDGVWKPPAVQTICLAGVLTPLPIVSLLWPIMLVESAHFDSPWEFVDHAVFSMTRYLCCGLGAGCVAVCVILFLVFLHPFLSSCTD